MGRSRASGGRVRCDVDPRSGRRDRADRRQSCNAFGDKRSLFRLALNGISKRGSARALRDMRP
jgi:hypothetical protein